MCSYLPKLVENELFDTFRSAQMEPYGLVLSGSTDLELEERTAFPFQLNPFGQQPLQ